MSSSRTGHDHDAPAPGADEHDGGHGHSHGLVSRSIVSSRDGLRAVLWSLLVLLVTTVLQFGVFLLTGSVALLADLVHNFGDALTAVPVGIALLMRSFVAEKRSGYFVVFAILVSALFALWQSIDRLLNPQQIDYLWPLAAAGIVGFVGNEIAAQIRTRAGKRIQSPALIADGAHARTDALVSLAVVGSAIVLALGFELGDPIIGLVITVVILRITWQSFRTVQADPGDPFPERHGTAGQDDPLHPDARPRR